MFVAVDGKFSFSSIHGKEYALEYRSLRPRIPKDNAGYFLEEDMDLIDLFIGSEGTLGIITEVEVVLIERHPVEFPLMLFFKEEESLFAVLDSLRSHPQTLALEYFGPEALELLRQKQAASPHAGLPFLNPKYRQALLVDLGMTENALESSLVEMERILEKNGGDPSATWDGLDEKDAARLRMFRHLVPESVNSIIAQVKNRYPEVTKLGTDLAVPEHAFREMMDFYRKTMEESGIPFVIFGHIGDCHVHLNILPRSPGEFQEGKRLVELFAQKAVILGGTVSAEHGIGKLKRRMLELMYTPEELHVMKGIKKGLDPGNLLNRGVLFSP
jgi:D-lactate dehydrogenase (cytochrome)